MKALVAISACAFLAAAAPAFAGANSTMKHELKANGSPSGSGYSHAAQPGKAGTESGKTPSEGRASANDAMMNKTGKNGASSKMRNGANTLHTGGQSTGGAAK